MSSLGLAKGDVFVKFGKRGHIEALYEAGALRIQPASFFRDENHIGAIQDDEQNLPISVVLSREDVIKLVINPQDVPSEIPDQRVDVQFQSSADYWLYCLTNSIAPRLFLDFGADACVVIYDRQRFRDLLRETSGQNLGGASMREGNAHYVDPLLPDPTEIFVPLCKHFRYSYQDEYRFCWLPNPPVQRLEHVDLQLGTLKEIAELIIL